MIVVAGHLIIRPERRDAATEAINAVAEKTRAEEANLEYRFGFDTSDANRVNVFERWESQAGLDAHVASPHLAEFLRTILDLLGGPTELVRYDVSGSTTLS
ncbi:MAG: antibiotic biosynthesis monooxygenase [Acidimicrobiales bacterium]|nr:antibiotic biosynthesis monooxygenase [Acidimicrobiales bacterium]